jgi:RNA polymerase sigma factor (sigma-70 family)
VIHSPPGTPLCQLAEATVVALAMSGDQLAFGELVRRRQGWLRSLLRRLCRDASLADDLAQQVFLKAWLSIATLRSVTAFGAWLRRLAVNEWLAHMRAAPPPMAALDIEEQATAAPVAAGERLDLDRALGALGGDERLCVVLAYSEGMSHAEISSATGLPLGTVKSHVRRGAQRLRELLHAYEPATEQVHAG